MALSTKAKEYLKKRENSWYGFWVKNYKLSFLLVGLLILYGTWSAIQIPKESSPDVKFGLVQIFTAYPGANPLDIDNVITEPIESKIKNIAGIDKFESSSAVGISSVIVTLENGVDTKNFINEVNQAIGTLSFPDEVFDPTVTELSTDNEILFQMILYGDKEKNTIHQLRSLAHEFAHNIEGKGGIVDVSVGGGGGGFQNSMVDVTSQGGSNESDYNITILLDADKITSYGLSLTNISQTIKAFNNNLPLGNFALGDLVYDYRISGKKQEIADLLNIPIQLPTGKYVFLYDIATITREYKNKTVSYGGEIGEAHNYAVELTIYKAKRKNIFSTAYAAKNIIIETLKKPLFQGLSVTYTRDLSDIIIDDYKNLGTNALQAVILIFLVTWFFIGLRQSLIATLSMPIAFFITFIYLNTIGSTLNFLTNFSLVLTFGMGIDTVIVIIEAAYEYMKKGFHPKTAVLIAMKNYAFPNISSSLCNMIVFLPMLLLPGIIGKFLSFIPITVFVTLVGSTVLASTLNNALFSKFNKDLPYYYEDDDKEGTFTDVEHEILNEERSHKLMKGEETQPRSDRWVQKIAHAYITMLRRTMRTKKRRTLSYVLPIILLVASFVFLAPSIGFKLFPSGDNPFMDFQIIGKEGTDIPAMDRVAQGIDTTLAAIPEIKSYQIDVQKGQINLLVILTKKEERSRDSFVIQKEIFNKLAYLPEQGYKLEGSIRASGPPQGKAVGIKLVAESSNQLDELKRVSLDFEEYLKTIPGAANVTNSSARNPGQFTFVFSPQKLADLGLTPYDVQFEIANALQGTKAGTIMLENTERDIVLKFADLYEDVAPEKILDTPITTRQGIIKLGEIATYQIDQSLSSLQRVDGDLVISITADTEPGVVPTKVQPKLESYAKTYAYPAGISYAKSGENEENKELIQSAFVALGLALFLVFAILVFEFNSFGKPLIILYSILTALLGANIGMFITGNPYSMPFMIGFISLIGIVVNMAIFLVDRINENIQRGLSMEQSIIEAGTTRFKPVIISSITTIFGIIGVAFQDEFWAGLGFTVVFGLLFCAFITLFALPNLFYAGYYKSTHHTELE